MEGDEITAVFISDDRTALAWEVANGDGGLFVIQAGYSEAEEVQDIGAGWIPLGGGR